MFRLLLTVWFVPCSALVLLAQFHAGASQAIITPYDTAYTAGHSHDRICHGISGDIYAKAGIIKNDEYLITFLTLDCIGLPHPPLEAIREGIQRRLPDFPVNQIVLSSTHRHSGPDVVGLRAAHAHSLGIDSAYMTFLIHQSVDAVIDAYHNIVPASANYIQTTHGAEWVYDISEADELDRSLTAIQFVSSDDKSILSLSNFACHPTFLDAVNDKLSSDYIGGFYKHMDRTIGGINLFLQGAIGAWVQAEHKDKTIPQAFDRGKALAEQLVQALNNPQRLTKNDIQFQSKKINLPVAHEHFRLPSDHNVVNRSFGDSVAIEIAYFRIGEAEFATHPGETTPSMSWATIEMMKQSGPKFILGLGMDALGYILKPSFFDSTVQMPHGEYLGSMSLGVHTQDLVLSHLRDMMTPHKSEVHSLESELDAIIQEAIDSMAFPGCQIAVAYRDQIVINKSYGHHTYDNKQKVANHHLYDIASLTKVTTGLPLLMKLYGNGLVDLDAPISNYLREMSKSNKAQISQRDMLAHKARLQAYIVFWQHTLRKNGTFKAKTFSTKAKRKYTIKIADGLYMHQRMHKKMMKVIIKSPLRQEKAYRYSGLYFLLLPRIIERLTDGNILELLDTEIYAPLGLDRISYHPLRRFPKSDIVPTEYDSLFRKQLIQGYVHDEAAAMLGVSCNAGLFSSAEELCKLFMMYKSYGSYDGRQVIDSSVLKEFTNYQFEEEDNRRGLGFDKPLLVYDEQLSYVAQSASRSSFGHSGFTGTMAWADPEKDIVFIFLSNRVYPSRSRRNIYNLNVRPRLHQAVYDHYHRDLSNEGYPSNSLFGQEE